MSDALNLPPEYGDALLEMLDILNPGKKIGLVMIAVQVDSPSSPVYVSNMHPDAVDRLIKWMAEYAGDQVLDGVLIPKGGSTLQ